MITRRVLFALLPAFLLPLLTAASSHAVEDSPDVVLRKFYMAIDQGDLATANALFDSGMKGSTLVKDTAQFLRDNGGMLHFNILNVGPVKREKPSSGGACMINYEVRFKNGTNTGRLLAKLSRQRFGGVDRVTGESEQVSFRWVVVAGNHKTGETETELARLR